MVPMTCIVLYPIAEKLLFEPIHSVLVPGVDLVAEYPSLIFRNTLLYMDVG